MRRLQLALFAAPLALFACDNNNYDADISALQARIAELETTVATLTTRLTAAETVGTNNTTALSDAAPTLAAADELLALVLVEDGDVVVEGANLRIRWNDVAGKGNVIIGDDAPRGECVGGTSAGRVCGPGGYQCSGGTCETVANPQKTGHHNLVIGNGHRYQSQHSIVAGQYSTVGDASAVLGGLNNTANNFGVVVGGENNTAGAEWLTVVLGGEGQTTTTNYETIPPTP